MKKLIVYDGSSIEPNPIKNFLDRNDLIGIQRKYFINLYPFMNLKNKTPYFITDFNFKHHQDVKNIEIARKIKKIDKKNLSLIIFDSHTDMYQEGEGYYHFEKKVTMANWIAYMVSREYSNISLIGVTDFTHSSRQRKGFEYGNLKNKVSFFLGENYKQEKDFKEYNGEIKLNNIKDFFDASLMENSFISFDSDVSSDFTNTNSKFAGRLGNLGLEDCKKIINYIKENSNLIGFSFFATGFAEAFNEKDHNLNSLIN
ncbi:MAG: hypothetical protein WC812_02425 [Candidatus Pacearchaeota archaeon]|jgi:hypothetical protein